MRLTILLVMLYVTAFVAGCSKPQPTAATSSEAISQSESLQTADAKARYLVDQANAFIAGKQYNDAMQTAQYVLSNVKADSEEAKAALEKAASKLKDSAQEMASTAQGEMNKMLGR